VTADDDDHQLLPVAKLAALEIVRHLWVTGPGKRVAAEDVEPTPLASDLLRRFRMPAVPAPPRPLSRRSGNFAAGVPSTLSPTWPSTPADRWSVFDVRNVTEACWPGYGELPPALFW
jgi:hypothetical protein